MKIGNKYHLLMTVTRQYAKIDARRIDESRINGKRMTVYTLASLKMAERFKVVARLKWEAETTQGEQQAKRAARASAT
jgi:hypothetical protein